LFAEIFENFGTNRWKLGGHGLLSRKKAFDSQVAQSALEYNTKAECKYGFLQKRT